MTDVGIESTAVGGTPMATTQTEEETFEKKGFGIGAYLCAAWLVLIILAAIFASYLPGLEDPLLPQAEIARQGPLEVEGHLLGGDALGRDMIARAIYGARASLQISFAAIAIGMVIGGTVGLIAGYFRGRVDSFLTAGFDILLSFPQLVLALMLVTFLRGTQTNTSWLTIAVILLWLVAAAVAFATRNLVGVLVGAALLVALLLLMFQVFTLPDFITSTGQVRIVATAKLVLIAALGIVGIPILARITRTSALTWSQREFVTAAKAQGATDRRIIFREVLPNVLPAMLAIALLGVGVAMIAEAGLSILGVGTPPPTPSWGNMIADGRNLLSEAPHIVFIPSICIFLTVLSLNYLGDVIRDHFDVREAAI